jgi:hypothetical protein
MHVYTRKVGQDQALEVPYEKPVIVPELDDKDPVRHAWADARFATDIMAEHGVFFALLMPEELAGRERAEALQFAGRFTELFKQIDGSDPPERGDLKSFTGKVIEHMKPFIDYKARLGEAQQTGRLRSLVWPLFFDHTRHEAERWTRRLESYGRGEPEFDRKEVATFWTNIMDEHARFVAHLLDPDEYDLIEKCMQTSYAFRQLGSQGIPPHSETDSVLTAAQTILDFKTETARAIEGAKIKSIIDPRLADHVRREALKFVDELKRAV